MPTSYLPYEPNQDLLLPHSLREWLPEDHLAHYISDTIDALDLPNLDDAISLSKWTPSSRAFSSCAAPGRAPR